ncbi:MAG: aspartate aminotransferase family protein [Caldilineaceae bacterium]|nr:aspartate aminotransferase family protein [Caldilineaceae bacterium]
MSEDISALREIELRMSGGFIPKRAEITFARGEGAWLFDTDGNRFLDFTSSQGIAMLGYSHPDLAAALSRQAETLTSLSSFLYGEARGRFYAKLSEVLPDHLPYAFLVNSGTETIETALKLARITTGRANLVAASKAFHGRTSGSLALTWNPRNLDVFGPLLPGVSHMPYNNVDALRDVVTEETAGVFLEVIQGEGGVNLGAPEFLQAVQQRCRETGALLIADEIQTGIGRTGKWFAIEHHDLKPDILCTAKGLGGGFPMGAVAFGDRVQEHIFVGIHGSTFGGNPLACAAGLAALTAYHDHDLIGHSARMGAYLLESLKDALDGVRIVRDIRGLGLMIGIELRARAAPILRAMLEEHRILLLNAGPRVLRLLPPLIITRQQADMVVVALTAVLER